MAKRREILEEFEKSGLTGAGFAALAGIKHQTFASWVQERRRERGAGGPGPAGKHRKEMCFLEAMVEKAAGASGRAELSGEHEGVRGGGAVRHEEGLQQAPRPGDGEDEARSQDGRALRVH